MHFCVCSEKLHIKIRELKWLPEIFVHNEFTCFCTVINIWIKSLYFYVKSANLSSLSISNLHLVFLFTDFSYNQWA